MDIVIAVVITALSRVRGLQRAERREEDPAPDRAPLFDRGSAVPARHGRAARAAGRSAATATASSSTATEIFPAMLAAIRGAQRDDHLRDLHLLVGRDRQASSPTRSPSARAPASRCTCCSTGSAAQKMDEALVDEMKSAGVEIAEVPPAALVRTSAASTTARTASCWSSTAGSASPAASASPTSGPATRRTPSTGATRTSGSRARSSRRCRPSSWTTGSRPPARCCTAPTTFPPLEPVGERRGAGVQQLAERRQREHAADVPAVDHRRASGRSTSRASYFVPDELAVADAGRGDASAA